MESAPATIGRCCAELGLVGQGLVDSLAQQLPSMLPAGRAPQPALVTGPAGSGRSLVAQVAHRVSAGEPGRGGPLLTLTPTPSTRPAESRLDGLLAAAAGGTLVIDGVEGLDRGLQSALGQRMAAAATGEWDQGPDTPLLVLTSVNQRADLRIPGVLDPGLRVSLPDELQLSPLCERGKGIQELAQHFLSRFAARCCPQRRLRFTRRALSDIRQAVEGRRLPGVAALETTVNGALAAALQSGELTDRVPGRVVLEYMQGPQDAEALRVERAVRDLEDLQARLPELVDHALLVELARRHEVPADLLGRFCSVVGNLAQDADGERRSYSQVVNQVKHLSRVALWLVSGARTQVDFRRFFGTKSWQRPTKSVAWSIFHDVFPNGPEGGA